MTDPYKTLKVKKNASKSAIKNAYRKRAKEAHPDREGDASEFREVNAAYKLLMDDTRRARFDTTGEADEAAADNAMAQAVSGLSQILQNILGQLLSQGRDPAQYDLVKLMRDALAQGKKEMDTRKKPLVAKQKTLTKLLGRFTADGDNFLEKTIEFELRNIEMQIQGIGAEKARMSQAEEILKRFTFRCDPRQMNNILMTASTATFFTRTG